MWLALVINCLICSTLWCHIITGSANTSAEPSLDLVLWSLFDCWGPPFDQSFKVSRNCRITDTLKAILMRTFIHCHIYIQWAFRRLVRCLWPCRTWSLNEAWREQGLVTSLITAGAVTFWGWWQPDQTSLTNSLPK